jgi:hypothetical protein
MSFAMGLWIRETALRLRAEGIDLARKTLSNINAHQGLYTPEENTNDSWVWKTGGQRPEESLEWLI